MPLLERFGEHFLDEGFQRDLDRFVEDHCREFARVTEAQLAGEDNDVEHWARYQQFQALFEEKIGAFLEAEGVSQEEFFAQCRSASAPADGSMVIDLLLATSEYEAFLVMMHAEGSDRVERDEGKSSS